VVIVFSPVYVYQGDLGCLERRLEIKCIIIIIIYNVHDSDVSYEVATPVYARYKA
jgi:hypothetical protein